MSSMLPPDAVIVGDWNGQPIWRPKTQNERLSEARINPEVANLYIAQNEQPTMKNKLDRTPEMDAMVKKAIAESSDTYDTHKGLTLNV